MNLVDYCALSPKNRSKENVSLICLIAFIGITLVQLP